MSMLHNRQSHYHDATHLLTLGKEESEPLNTNGALTSLPISGSTTFVRFDDDIFNLPFKCQDIIYHRRLHLSRLTGLLISPCDQKDWIDEGCSEKMLLLLYRTTTPDIVVMLLPLFVVCCCTSISIRSNAYTPPPTPRTVDMAGIWRVSHKKSLLPKEEATTDETTNVEMILKLKGDGTFEQSGGSNSLLLEGGFTNGGSWVYEESMLKLASNRQEENHHNTKDTTLFGKVKVDMVRSVLQDYEGLSSSDEQQHQPEQYEVCLSMPHATVCIGKFLYPRKHNAFWEDPMLFDRSDVATVELHQILGNLNSRLEQEASRMDEIAQHKVAKFHKKDFYNRSFYLSTQPLKVNTVYAAIDIHYDDTIPATFGAQVVPITFHSNNTFTAQGSQKFLRGRYGITGDNGDRLWFQVSLFGAGRSAPGSVYSEGAGLTHDDRRGYRGDIQEYKGGRNKNQTVLHVQGYTFNGNDLGIMKRPSPAGRFVISEILDAELDEYIEDDEDDEDGMEEEAFQ